MIMVTNWIGYKYTNKQTNIETNQSIEIVCMYVCAREKVIGNPTLKTYDKHNTDLLSTYK